MKIEMDDEIREVIQASKERQNIAKIRVQELGKEIGYGNMMSLAQELWRKNLEKDGIVGAGGEFVVGPCALTTVACGCKEPYNCDWCMGSGWLTVKCKKAKEKAIHNIA